MFGVLDYCTLVCCCVEHCLWFCVVLVGCGSVRGAIVLIVCCGCGTVDCCGLC